MLTDILIIAYCVGYGLFLYLYLDYAGEAWIVLLDDIWEGVIVSFFWPALTILFIFMSLWFRCVWVYTHLLRYKAKLW